MLRRGRGAKGFLVKKELDKLLGELIGEPVEISRSRDRKLIGISGRILLETKEAFLIDTGRKRLRVYKRGTEFIFPRLKLRVRGEVLYVDPVRRTKVLDLKRRRIFGRRNPF